MKVVVLLGPTAVGKTSLSLALARRFGAEIINADSVQVYRGMDIGTAKPTPRQRQGVPHHLIDVADPDQPVTAAVYAHLSAAVLWELERRQARVILTGGSPHYIDVAIGRQTLPDLPPDPLWRAQAQTMSLPELQEALRQLDPQAYAHVDAQNPRRLVRAVELARGGQVPPAALPRPPLEILQVGLSRPREELRARIDIRAAALFSGGIVRETEELLGRGFGPGLRPMRSLGYREALDYLSGRVTLHEAVRLLQRGTHRLAKRQMTWWRRDHSIVWLPADAPDSEADRLLAGFWDR